MTGRRRGPVPPPASSAVFTAPFGDADPVMPVLEVTADVDYLVLTDRPLRVPTPWMVRRVEVPSSITTDRLRNRFCKLRGSQLLPEYERSLYIDTHLQVVADLSPLLDDFTASGAGVGLMQHPKSSSVREEIERSLHSGRITDEDFAARWPPQQQRHQGAGFPDDLGVFFAALILRDHRWPEVARFEDEWWTELTAGVTRDQVALPFVVWKRSVAPYRIPLDWSLAPYFRHWNHLPGPAPYRRLARWFEARLAIRPHYRWVLRALHLRSVLASLLALTVRSIDGATTPGEPGPASTRASTAPTLPPRRSHRSRGVDR